MAPVSVLGTASTSVKSEGVTNLILGRYPMNVSRECPSCPRPRLQNKSRTTLENESKVSPRDQSRDEASWSAVSTKRSPLRGAFKALLSFSPPSLQHTAC